jgi:hypothetical protein
MEKEALVLRARAERAKLAAEYAADAEERRRFEEQARAYTSQAMALEDCLDEWRV